MAVDFWKMNQQRSGMIVEFLWLFLTKGSESRGQNDESSKEWNDRLWPRIFHRNFDKTEFLVAPTVDKFLRTSNEEKKSREKFSLDEKENKLFGSKSFWRVELCGVLLRRVRFVLWSTESFRFVRIGAKKLSNNFQLLRNFFREFSLRSIEYFRGRTQRFRPRTIWNLSISSSGMLAPSNFPRWIENQDFFFFSRLSSKKLL